METGSGMGWLATPMTVTPLRTHSALGQIQLSGFSSCKTSDAVDLVFYGIPILITADKWVLKKNAPEKC